MRAVVGLCILAMACGGGSRPGSDGPPGGPDADLSCVTATYDGEQQPAAFLVLLDRSSSMSQNNKWTFAAQAIVAALDQDVFDDLHVGLYSAPSGETNGPACILGLSVPCATPAFPQIDLELAGTEKSSAATGVRRRIKDWLTTNSPDTGLGDGTPLYNAIEAASGALRLWPEDGGRAMMVVTDGSISCTSLSSRQGYPDCNDFGNGPCYDWEYPQNIIDMVAANHVDASSPIDTYFVGVPGADTYDPTACNYPPYRMRLALSAMAYAGAMEHTPAGCTGTSFTQGGADPTLSCHFDMTQPGGFSAQALADTIAYIRGQTTGCIFEMPVPPQGQSIDPARVNVEYTFDGMTILLARRADPAFPCTQSGCWDYTADNRIELLGQACVDITTAESFQVRILTGCVTISE
jgi:hypothetical protein